MLVVIGIVMSVFSRLSRLLFVSVVMMIMVLGMDIV